MKRSRYLKISAGVMGIVVVYAIVFSTGEFLNPYRYVSEVLAEPDRYRAEEVQAAAMIVNGTYSRSNGVSTFVITDGNTTLNVIYEGNLPAAFREDVGIVVIGRLISGDTFKATKLLAKCPSKYEEKIVNTLDQKTGKDDK